MEAADAVSGGFQRRRDMESDHGHTRSTYGDRTGTAGSFFRCGGREDLRKFRGSEKARACSETFHKICNSKRCGDIWT